MTVRNKMVSIFGIKDLGLLGEISKTKTVDDYQVSDHIGIFELAYLSQSEITLGELIDYGSKFIPNKPASPHLNGTVKRSQKNRQRKVLLNYKFRSGWAKERNSS